ncbi:Ribose-phosphate pyrophosphokinase [Sesbania bispinosa]|nr:Ribose-phosphate pyrophosphokinase [Sesbania bispinosa]
MAVRQRAVTALPNLIRSLRKEQPLKPQTHASALPSLRRAFSLYDQINLIDQVPDDQLRFQGYNDTGFTVNGVEYEGSLLCVGNLLLSWKPKKFSEITAERNIQPVDPELRRFVRSTGMKLEAVDSITPRFASIDSSPHISLRNDVRCKVIAAVRLENGKPSPPSESVVNRGSGSAIPSFLVAPNSRIQDLVNRNDTRLRIFSGTANPALAQEIACYMGLELGKIKIKRFADGEIYVQLQESVRGCDVFLVQPTCPPANENLMELLIMIDACRRASAKNITAVIPYFGYARADRKTQGRESIAAKLVANLITEAGANRVLACDLHSGQSMGYFDIPVDHVYGQPVILDYLASKTICADDLVVVSPDVGGVARARAFAKKLSDAPLAIVDKRRHGHNVAEVMNLIGDVKGKVAVMVDDMIDTAGTIAKGAALLHQEGAREVYACTTHAVFSPPAIERLSSGILSRTTVFHLELEMTMQAALLALR